MAMMNKPTQYESLKAGFTLEQRYTYLPAHQGLIQERWASFRERAVYRIWKRMIKKHGPDDDETLGRLTILDAGCGPGKFVRCLRRWFPNANLFALDTSDELLEYASQRTERVNWVNGSAEQIPFGDQTFDVLSCLQVIEHLRCPERFFLEASRVLKPEGLLLVSTPNPRGLAARMLGNKWHGIRNDHISLNLPDVWRKMLEANGFTILSEGTTLLNGIPVVGRFPVALPFQLLQAIFGWFPWRLGASYMAIARKEC